MPRKSRDHHDQPRYAQSKTARKVESKILGTYRFRDEPFVETMALYERFQHMFHGPFHQHRLVDVSGLIDESNINQRWRVCFLVFVMHRLSYLQVSLPA